MTAHALAPETVRRLAVFRALNLGDMVVAVPALRALRAGFPAAEITLIGLPWAAEVARRLDRYVDRFLVFPGWPGLPEVPFEPARTDRFLAEQHVYGYDVAVQMHGSGGASNPFVLALGAGTTVGYYEGAPPAGLSRGAPWPADDHEIHRVLGLPRLLGCPDRGAHLELPLLASDRAEAHALLDGSARQGRVLVGLHPGAAVPARHWPAESFAALGDALTRRHGARVVLTGGPGEVPVARAVAERMSAPCLNLAGRTSFGGLAAVIATLDLFVSNDTGPAHVAAAVDTPSIMIFGPGDPRGWAPLDAARHPIVREPVACSPCCYRECPTDHSCLRGIPPARVLALADQLLTAGVAQCSA